MKNKVLLMSLFLIVCASGEGRSSQAQVEASPAKSGRGAYSDNAADGAAGTALPSNSTELRVAVGKSLLVNSPSKLQRVSVTNPDIASAAVVTTNQILIHGQKPGSVTLILWDEQDRPRSFDLSVELDMFSLRESLAKAFPGQKIDAQQSAASIVLTGNVAAKQIADQAAAIAGTFSPTVVNLLQVAENRQVVLLQVKFAEVDRAAIEQQGLNLFSTGAAGNIGAISTQQFEQISGNIGAVPSNVERGSDPKAPSLASGGIGRSLSDTPAVFGLTDLLNVFIFRPDLNLGAAVKALQQKNVLQILAEPNVMAMNGKEASFLAGGEFPFPIVQTGNNYGVTIQFKEFGVRLNFTPQIQPDGMIRLKVAPEVSSLDFSNALQISGFLIPALSTRRATTEVELRDGQSFAIAGLMDNRLSEIASRVPVLSNIPVIGYMFRSRAQNKTKTELLVTVTPRLVQPTTTAQQPPIPDFPKDFLDQEKFDGKAGETPARK